MSLDSAVLRGSDVGDLPVVSFAAPAVRLVAVDDGTDDDTDADGATSAEEASVGPDPAEIYQQGWDAGHEAALDSMEARRAHMVHALGEAIEAVDLALEHHHRAADQLAVDLALELTRLLLDRELATSDDPGREAVLRCLGEIPTGRRTMIRLNPDDLRHLEDRETLLAGRDCELVADPELRSGDAAVDFDGGSIDARLAAGLARVAEVLQP